MDAYALFDALTDVQDSFLTETERRLYGKSGAPSAYTCWPPC